MKGLWFIVIFLTLILITIAPFGHQKQENSLYQRKQILLDLNDVYYSKFNEYRPDGNSSVKLAIDIGLLGEGKLFENESIAKTLFSQWLAPMEKKFSIAFHMGNITTYDPGADSLDISIKKVTESLSWKNASSMNDPNLNGNGYDWLIIYQKSYAGGQNRVNSLYGNVIIVSHNQPLFWTSNQLILLHEVAHLFGGRHNENGIVDPTWYGSNTHSILNYEDLTYLHINGWDINSLPIDDHNFEIMNSSKYRYDLIDADLDGLPNYYEYRYMMNPNFDDAFHDIEDDGLVNLYEFQIGTNPLLVDSDNDSFSDWAEDYLGTSALNASQIPFVNNPIILPLTNDTKVTNRDYIVLKWRSISSNPSTYHIIKNGSIISTELWNSELIQFHPEELTVGTWNYSCQVIDLDGDYSISSIIIKVIKPETSLIYNLSLIYGLVLLSYVIRKRNRR